MTVQASEETVRERCRAITASSRRCRNLAVDERGFCRIHASPPKLTRPGSLERRPPEALLDERVRKFADFLQRRLTGDYAIDTFGFDKDLTEEVLRPFAMFLYNRWWRVTSLGIENVPATGPALLVSNHSGTVPWDGIMLQFGLREEHPAHRHLRLIAANLVFASPVISHLARKSGNAVAHEEDAFRLLSAGELVGVFPEGFKGVGKGWSQRYRLQRFGRGGFVEVAMRARVPIVPVSIVGAEEIYPMIANLKPLARMFGFPYFPITPFFPALGPLGLIPLPSKWTIEYGPPIPTDVYPEDSHEDTMLVFEVTDHVRDTIQQMLNRNLAARRGVFA